MGVPLTEKLTYVPPNMSAGFMSRTNDPVFPRVTLSVLWIVITGRCSPSVEYAELASLFAVTRGLAAKLLGGGRVGPPSGARPAWTIGASARATTNNTAVNWVFRFFMLLNFLSLFWPSVTSRP